MNCAYCNQSCDDRPVGYEAVCWDCWRAHQPTPKDVRPLRRAIRGFFMGHVVVGLVASVTMLVGPEDVPYRYQIGLGALGIATLALVLLTILENRWSSLPNQGTLGDRHS